MATKCKKCKSEIPEGRTVCLKCGAVLEHKPSIKLQYLRHKVEEYLQEFGFDTRPNKYGDYILRREKTAIVLSLSETPSGITFLDLTAMMAKDIRPKAKDEVKLYKTLLNWNVTDELGKFALSDDDIQVKYRLLGNDLDRDELGYSVLMLLNQAEHLQERVKLLLGEKELAGAGKKK